MPILQQTLLASWDREPGREGHRDLGDMAMRGRQAGHLHFPGASVWGAPKGNGAAPLAEVTEPVSGPTSEMTVTLIAFILAVYQEAIMH